MDIVFSYNNNKEVYILPIVPPNIPVNQTVNNETFESVNLGDYKLIGNEGLRSVSIASFFPTKFYSFIKNGASDDGWIYVDFLNRMKRAKTPFRIVMTTKSGFEMINMPVSIDSFSYSIDKVGDIVYNLEISEYKFVVV